MTRIVDRLVRFVSTVFCVLYGTQTLFWCIDATTPLNVILFFIVTVAFFGGAYWWMFDSKKNNNGW